jgi:hypothetical protein
LLRKIERFFEAMNNKGVGNRIRHLARHDNVRAPRKRLANIFKGLATHDNMMPARCHHKEAHIGGHLPWERIARTDSVIASDGGYHGNYHTNINQALDFVMLPPQLQKQSCSSYALHRRMAY